ncbi:MAG: amidohydrolase family protein [Synechococcaceae cyanobacterium ELA263]
MSTPERLPPLLVPRALLDPRLEHLGPTDAEGLVAVCLEHGDGRILALHPWPQAGEPASQHQGCGGLPLAITPPVEPHAHLDKPFTAAAFANPDGTVAGAFAANIEEAEQRQLEGVLARGEQALQLAWGHGLRAMRSHIDSLGAAAAPSWEALTSLRQRWAGRLELQLVAMVPVQHWLSPEGEALAARVAATAGVLGGVIGPPFASRRRDRDGLVALLRLAERLGCPVDLHIDEGSGDPGRGVAMVSRLMLEMGSAVPLVCSHASSMALLADRPCQRLCETIAAAGIGVIALPTTNLWLLGRRAGATPLQRIQAPIRQLQSAGVEVALGGDNVQDPWYPGGAFDPIELLRLAALISHVVPWQRQGLSPFTTAPSRLLDLAWDGVLRPGAPADLLVLGASSWGQLLAQAPQRRLLRGGQWQPPPACEAPSPLLSSLPPCR